MKKTFMLLFALLALSASAGPVNAAFTLTAYTGSYNGVDESWVLVNGQFWKIPGASIMDGVPLVLDESTAPSYGFDWNRLSTELSTRPNYYIGISLLGVNGGGGEFDSANYGFGPSHYPGLYVGSVVFTSKVDYTVFNQYIGGYLTRVRADMNVVPEPDALLMVVCMAIIVYCMWRIEK